MYSDYRLKNINRSKRRGTRRLVSSNRNATETRLYSKDEILDWSYDFWGYAAEYIRNWESVENIKYVNIPEKIAIQLDNFYVKCKHYESLGKDGQTIFRRALTEGPSFTKELKKERTYGFLKYHLSSSIEKIPEDIRTTKSYEDTFPFDHLPFWKEEVNDLKESFTEVKINSETLEKFEEVLNNILPDIELVEPVVEKYRTTRCKTDSESTAWHFEEVIKRDPTFTVKYDTVRSIIPVSPGNFRDAAILHPDSSYTINYLGKKILQILSSMENSAMNVNFENGWKNYNRILYKFSRKKKYSYLRDFKKCGLTMPREIISIVEKVLVKKYPRQNFEYLNIYQNWRVYLKDYAGQKDGYIQPPRGHALGQANELTTLIQIVIHYMNLDRSEEELGEPLKVDAVFWNDDSAFTGSLNDLELYSTFDIALCDELGLIVKPEQTAILDGGILFMEQYTSLKNWDTNKDVKLELAIKDKMFCFNIVEAKHCIRSMSFDIIGNERLENSLQELISYWGYEFYRDEYLYSDILGGWLLDIYNWHDITFYNEVFVTDELIPHMRGALYAEQVKLDRFVLRKYKNTLKKKEKWEPYSNDYLIMNKKIKDEILNIDSYTRQSSYLLKNGYVSISQKKMISRYWKTLLEERRKVFSKEKSLPMFIELINDAIALNKGRMFAIPENLISGRDYFFTEYEGDKPPLPGYADARYISEEEATAGYLKSVHTNDILCSVEPTIGHILSFMNYHVQSLPGYGTRENYYWSNSIDNKLYKYSSSPILTSNFYVGEFGFIPSEINSNLTLNESNPYLFICKDKEEYEQYIGIDSIELYLNLSAFIDESKNEELTEAYLTQLPEIVSDICKFFDRSIWKEIKTMQQLEDLYFQIAFKRISESSEEEDFDIDISSVVVGIASTEDSIDDSDSENYDEYSYIEEPISEEDSSSIQYDSASFDENFGGIFSTTGE